MDEDVHEHKHEVQYKRNRNVNMRKALICPTGLAESSPCQQWRALCPDPSWQTVLP